ncbi:group IID secretory phospholipase A2-like [Mauremys reevesii]|uniref:group IID secretory phospholipase A2-like n=1 Tax=Mauremys reevesii TaxID=260615 RepID=UPI00193F227C|nr:group IID secretory phospholipase A2-like [Mauremys reevesii]
MKFEYPITRSAQMRAMSSQRGGTDRLYKVNLSLSEIRSHPELQRLSQAQKRPCMTMKNLLVFALLFAYGAVMTQGSLWELQKMIKQVTGKNALWNYSMYGCYCGSGGKGTPKDDTDRCCQLHDCCYKRLKGHGCNAKLNTYSYYTSYGCHCGVGGKGMPKDATDWCCLHHDCCYSQLKAQNCRVIIDRYRYTYRRGVITCGPGSWCKRNICECDKAAALCMKRNLRSYNKKYRFYPNIKCTGRKPRC